ncbi:hypothetical protein K0J45_11220 [Shewanella alkalitolerans]|uniref:hypothetical protein n=1 Tax=Shewanella alkalitolerans TaxID=2864209 RepID=UPI001C65A508|nr:hypothetical protein [Shewanella alkalitolerans]QYJ96136.1 hypothetical protein K0J45_11220 [Shewanella alkalitolerans]
MQVSSSNLMPGLSSGASAISDAIAPQQDLRTDVIDVTPVGPAVPARDEIQVAANASATSDANSDTTGLVERKQESLEERLNAKLEYDQQTGGSRGAIGQYLLHQHAAQRDAISQMVGIDTYV